MHYAVIAYQRGIVVYCRLTEDGTASSKYILENSMIVFITDV